MDSRASILMPPLAEWAREQQWEELLSSLTSQSAEDNCLEGSNKNNHAMHVRDFTERMKNIVTPENLKMQLSKEPRAFFTLRQFIYLFRRQDSIGVIWKQHISTSNDELMNQAIFVERGGKILIDHCMIC